MTTYHTADIIVVGAGPIGLSMCQALSGSGLKLALVERQTQEAIADARPDGREIAVTHRTRAFMQDLHQWQLLDDSCQFLLKRAEVYNGNSAFVLGFDKPKQVHGRKAETLGYLVSNYAIRQSAYKVIEDQLNKSIMPFFGRMIDKVVTTNTYASVTLDNGEVIRAKLILAADSRLSFMRKALGISADMHDFGRTVMVFRTQHSKSNQQTAHEGFYYGKTLAVLPLGEYQSSMVVTASNDYAKELKAMSADTLASEMQNWLSGSLGQMTVTSPVYDYPLVGVHARRFYGQRSALLGDAAVGMHPVTAHGYNLGMEGVWLLSRGILKAWQAGDDIGDKAILRHYSHTHSLKTRAMYHGTNAIVTLYTDETLPAKVLRHAGLRFGQSFLPIKKLITHQLTG